MENVHLKNAELVRAKIEDLLPPSGPLDFDMLNINVQKLVNSTRGISSGVPLSMSSLIAQYSMSNFASQFQYKINLDGSKIPVNVVAFLLASSGQGKDSTVFAMEKALDPGYIAIEAAREESGRERAKARAEAEDGEDANWQKYYKPPQPLSNAISTAEGLTNRLNNFAMDGLGMPSVYVGELGSELGSNPNMADNIRLIAELFDLGNKKSKAIKDSERQDAEVKGMGMTALFVGSEDNIILDKQISQKFKLEFITKCARRSITVYPSKAEFDACIIDYGDYESMVERQELDELLSKEGSAYVGSASNDMANILLDSESRTIEVDDDALQAFKDYKMYTNSLGNGLNFIHKSVQLEQLHRSWKMFKLAGVYAMWDLEDSISMKHIKQAIYYVEKVGGYLAAYEEYASKENYELLLDYFIAHPEQTLSLHDLKKRGFINGSTGIDSRIKELVKLADSFASSDGLIAFEGDTMSFKPFESVGEHYASYVKVSGSKEERSTKCHSGFECKPTNFGKLKALLSNDTAYSPFRFTNGQRKNDNIISGASWVALDIDDSDITMNEFHDMIGEFNHHIATTSDKENPYKFRCILEFNKIVDLEPRQWKTFGVSLGKELGITIDPVTFTKSQIMFGYAGSEVISTLGESAYDITDCIKKAGEATVGIGKEHKLTRTQMRAGLDNPLETFKYAFNDDVSARSLALFRLWKHASDLGANADECEQLMKDCNYNFWSNPVSDERFDGYVRQMRNSFVERY